jgi:hypothetical protein
MRVPPGAEPDEEPVGSAQRWHTQGGVLAIESRLSASWRIAIDRRVVFADQLRERAVRLDEGVERREILADICSRLLRKARCASARSRAHFVARFLMTLTSVRIDTGHLAVRIGKMQPQLVADCLYSSARRSAAAVANGASARAASSIAPRISSCGRPDRLMTSPSTAPTPKISTGM